MWVLLLLLAQSVGAVEREGRNDERRGEGEKGRRKDERSEGWKGEGRKDLMVTGLEQHVAAPRNKSEI